MKGFCSPSCSHHTVSYRSNLLRDLVPFRIITHCGELARFLTSCLDMQRIEPKGGRLESSSALNEVNDQDDDGNYEQEVDQAAANVADEAKKPEHDQDDNYSPEQWVFLSVELNSRRRIYPEVHLLAKLFQNIESKKFCFPFAKFEGRSTAGRLKS
jgi:hypothetical protein